MTDERPREEGAEPEQGLHGVFSGDVPRTVRAWRREIEPEVADAPAILALPDSLLQAIEAVPRALDELKREVARQREATAEALSEARRDMEVVTRALRDQLTQIAHERISPSDPEPGEPEPGTFLSRAARRWGRSAETALDAPGGAGRGAEPPAVSAETPDVDRMESLREALREMAATIGEGLQQLAAGLTEQVGEVKRHAERVTRTTEEDVVRTRADLDRLGEIVGQLRLEVRSAGEDTTQAVTAANEEAARAFTRVADELHALLDRQERLDEEVRSMALRMEWLEHATRGRSES